MKKKNFEFRILNLEWVNSTFKIPYSIFHTRGFTLIEMILYVAISSTVLIGLTTALSVVLESRVRNQTITEVDSQGLQVMQIITQTIRNAKVINLPVSGSASSSISIKTLSTSTNPTIFNVANGVVYITEGANASIPLTNSHVFVSDISFQNLSRIGTTDIIHISFQITYLSGSTKGEYNYSKIFTGSENVH